MTDILLNSIALDPNRWTKDKIAFFKLDQLLEPVANAGFRSVEVWQYHISRESEKTIKDYKAQADSLGVAFPVVGIYPKLHLRGNAKSQELDLIKRLLDYGDMLGAHLYKIFVGNISSAEISDLEYGFSVEFMHEFLDLAAKHQTVIAGETHERTLFDSPESSKTFLNEINSPLFKICFQPFDLSDTTRALADYLTLSDQVVHIHYQGRRDGEFEFLENSDLDYRQLTLKLVESEFSGNICIEFVKACIANNPDDFQLELVLKNAQRDRDFVLGVLEDAKVGT